MAAEVFTRQNAGNVRALVEVEAMQWDGSYAVQGEIVTWAPAVGWFDDAYYIAVESPTGEQRANPGDWVVRDAQGFSVYPAARFDQTFRRADRV